MSTTSNHNPLPNSDQAELEAPLREEEHLQALADVERAETDVREAARRLEDAVQSRRMIDVAAVSQAAGPNGPG